MTNEKDDPYNFADEKHITLGQEEISGLQQKYGFTEEQIEQFLEAFAVFDRDCEGAITCDKLGKVMKAVGQRASLLELEALISGVDTDNSGTIDFDEFLQMMSRKVSADPVKELQEVFTVFDINGDGFISADELHEILSRMGETMTKEEVEGMIKEADTNSDGVVDFTEFKAMLIAK